jgi:hypothetical protein
MDAMIVLLDWFKRDSDVPKRIFLELIIKNGILLTNMMSPPSVMLRYLLINTGGILLRIPLTRSGALWTVFPFSEPTSGPKNMFGSQYVVLRNGTVWQQLVLNNLEERLCAWPSNSFLDLPS